MGAALALGSRGQGLTRPNPCVGCVIVKAGVVVGRGWTQPSGRPHAEAMAVAEAGSAARGATAYVTLEPCAAPGRGPACADVLIEAGIAHVVAAIGDPFPAVDGKGFARLRAAGIDVTVGVGVEQAARSMAGFLTRQRLGRPHVTLKLALSLDGAAAMADGRSQWITGTAARAHVHLSRSRSDAILVGLDTFLRDGTRADVRINGLEDRSPSRILLSSKRAAQYVDQVHLAGWSILSSLDDLGQLSADCLYVEGGAGVAASMLVADLVDTLHIYRAPVLIGSGRTLGDIGLGDLSDAHGRWARVDTRRLGSDTLDVYERIRG